MNNKFDGGPAFPADEWLNTEDPRICNPRKHLGMTLRDYFAIHAPEPSQDDISSQQHIDHARIPHSDYYKPAVRGVCEIKSDLRYEYADAMIARRNK